MPIVNGSVSYDATVEPVPSFVHTYSKIVLMTDPAVAFLPDDEGYAPYHRGKDLGVYLKAANGSDFLGLVWPGTYWERSLGVLTEMISISS